jgi:hypothetical protein
MARDFAFHRGFGDAGDDKRIEARDIQTALALARSLPCGVT